MKADIHPEYKASQLPAAAATSSKPVRPGQALAIDVCNECHPFYTGKQKTLDTGGRVQRFADRFGAFGKKAPAAAE